MALDRFQKSDYLKWIKEILSEKDAKQGYNVSRIVDELIIRNYAHCDVSEKEKFKDSISRLLNSESKKNSEIKKCINPKTRKTKPGYYKLGQKKYVKVWPPKADGAETAEKAHEVMEDVINIITNVSNKKSTNYIGKSGEYAVMSELLWHGYNANNMSVDEGIDIVASKNNMFYFIQVKTTELNPDSKTARVQIKIQKFQQLINQQLRYIVVIRIPFGLNLHDDMLYRNAYLVFKESDIDRLWKEGIIKESNGEMSIKVDFSRNEPFLYNGNKTENIFYYLNKFVDL